MKLMTVLLAAILAAFILWLAVVSDAARRPSPAQITRSAILHARWHKPFPSWWLQAALCVHAHEGSWGEPGGIGPNVSGGMQIGSAEWAGNGGLAYAPLAYLATPHEQLHVAFTIWQRRGWWPWPNTARMCGLR